MIEESRKVSFCRQLSLLYKRNITSALRNPLQLLAVVILGLIQSFLLVCLFGGVGAETIDIIFVKNDKGIPIPMVDPNCNVPQIISNWLGTVFLAVSDQFIICAFAMILMIPINFTIYKREMGSHMYSSHAYFMAAILSNVCVNIFYPVLVSLLTFWFYEFPISNFGGFMCFLSV